MEQTEHIGKKRAHPRKRRRFQVRYVDDKGVARIGFTHDMSLGGVFVEAGNLPPIGQHLALDLVAHDGQKVRFRGRVVRQKRAPLALKASIPHGFGLGVTEGSEEYTSLVAAL
jgi:hypothetical protein